MTMKRLIPILMLLALLLTACDLRNRQSSEDYIPTGSASPRADWTPRESGLPGQETEKTTVKTVLSYDGEIPLTEPKRTCSYRLPMIDLGGAAAVACSQEIEERFGGLIRQSIEAVESWQTPILERLSYSSFTLADILTLRIDRLDLDGSMQEAWYTVDAVSGEAVTVERLFRAAGLSGKPTELLNEAVQELFARRFGTAADSNTQAPYYTALNETLEALSPLTVNRMHLTEAGKLIVAVELFDPDGGSSVETLTLP